MQIVFGSKKGGVAKSTSALACAGSLARYYRVAFADLDEEAYATTMGLGQEAVTNPLTAAPVTVEHPLISGGHLLLFRGGESMAAASESAVAAHLGRCAAAADILVVDTPPGHGHAGVVAALRAASVIVCPVFPEFQALAGYEKLVGACRAIGARAPIRVLLSRWEANTLLARDVHRELVTSHPGAAISAVIPKDQRAAESMAAALPVTLSAPSSPAAVAYRTAIYEIAATAGLRIPKGAI